MRALLVGLLLGVITGCSCSTDPCAAGMGEGTVDLRFAGVPSGAMGSVTLDGASAQTFTMAQSVRLPSGSWTATPARLTVSDAIVRSVFTAPSSTFCVPAGKTTSVIVTWSKVATSNRLWVANGSGGTGNLHGFDGAALGSTSTAASAWNFDVPGSSAIAFDKEGNLWALGATTSDPLVVRYPAAAFASAARATDRRLDVAGVSCFPRASSLAFDRSGNLYVASSCMRQVYKLTESALESANGTSAVSLTPALTLSGFMSTGGLAFDKDGNLHVADPSNREVARFDAASLTGTSAAPSVRYRAKANDQPADTSLLGVQALAFDTDGNLLAFDFGSNNVVYFYPSAQLTGTGTKTVLPGARVTVSVTGIPEGMAFDEGGGLWMPMRQGTVVRFSPAQLLVSTGAGAPTQPERVITGSALGYASDPAFFPAPAGVPLFHALP